MLTRVHLPSLLLPALALLLGACASPPASNIEEAGPLEIEAVRALPVGGADVLGSDTFNAFPIAPGDAVRVEVIGVTGKPFTQGWRITGIGASESPTSSQLVAKSRLGVTQGDALVVQFWARSVGGPAQTEFVFESDGDYVQSAQIPFNVLPRWTLYSVPFSARKTSGPGEAAARFRMGYANQSFELGGVVLKNYGPGVSLSSLPFAGFSYVGREATAAWRSAAAARIDRLRKADLTVKVVDATGNAVQGAAVSLEMTRHAFAFGSAVNADLIVDDSAEARKYRQTIGELFTQVVFENDLKWPGWESASQPTTLKALDYFSAQGIPVRGHNLLWGCAEDDCFPSDVPPLFKNPAGLRNRIDQHFKDILGATKGRIAEWDVINEPTGGTRFSDALGEDEMAAQLRRAKQLEPGARLVINENGTLGEGGNTAGFTRILERVQRLGGPLEGIGLQGHFNYKLTPPEDLNIRLNEYGKLGVPLSITEFDVNLRSEQLQADYLRDFLTTAFANEYVSSFTLWGFWEGRISQSGVALYRQDWSLKPSARAFKELLFKTWWTNISGPSNASGQYGTRGFLGDYKITVTVGGQSVVKSVKLKTGSPEFVVQSP